MIRSVPIRFEGVPAPPLQTSGTTAGVLEAAAQIGGLAIIAGAVAGAVAIAFRWYARKKVSTPPAVLLAVAVVAAYLNATTALGQVMGGDAVLSVRVALFNVSALLVGTVGALVGITIGDRLARTVLGGTGPMAVDQSLGRVVRAVGRVITVELPAEIDDVPGYDPVDPDTKATLEGKTFVFPRGLTVEELRERLARRLREDYRVGHVDVEIDADGTVTHLGLGSRAAGIGPTLPPESAALAIRADPAHAASAGDLVQVWTRNPHTRLLNAEVRGTAGEVVTLAIDAADASKLDTDERYKLVTLPVEERADRELTELLRAAEETLGVVEVGDGSSLAGTPIGALDVTVVAVHAGGPDDRIEALPARDRVLAAGDSLYVIARPDVIRRIESAADASEGTGERASSTLSSVTEPTSRDPPTNAAERDANADDESTEDRPPGDESTEDRPPGDETTLTDEELPERAADETASRSDEETSDESTKGAGDDTWGDTFDENTKETEEDTSGGAFDEDTKETSEDPATGPFDDEPSDGTPATDTEGESESEFAAESLQPSEGHSGESVDEISGVDSLTEEDELSDLDELADTNDFSDVDELADERTDADDEESTDRNTE
ncbi:TrkA C-terminal domain-containing protein [Halorhabdus rudnickae]|uniref:TrkA C-terminal domain-containing protein n=1 Tax=Halorhabdus rudnickae TaxID=1775544 RepID=UPI001FCE803F|nr:TrkA C-terminal domain-containing protein [Halorhabdus rudnickae]